MVHHWQLGHQASEADPTTLRVRLLVVTACGLRLRLGLCSVADSEAPNVGEEDRLHARVEPQRTRPLLAQDSIPARGRVGSGMGTRRADAPRAEPSRRGGTPP
mmetsp:Transcript_48576/g.114709  ORF Transcript_48576/g.114709 Transcript_48576/m.114709 type:complete len:103 (-) Transcript_48576:600-908(-)|eukprot:681254-Rhodomonas_salina.1